jgi:hypothetical protein
MLEGFEANRSVEHLGELIVEANRIGFFHDPDDAVVRAVRVFALHGIS